MGTDSYGKVESNEPKIIFENQMGVTGIQTPVHFIYWKLVPECCPTLVGNITDLRINTSMLIANQMLEKEKQRVCTIWLNTLRKSQVQTANHIGAPDRNKKSFPSMACFSRCTRRRRYSRSSTDQHYGTMAPRWHPRLRRSTAGFLEMPTQAVLDDSAGGITFAKIK